jgi:hypothetical protein
MAEALTAQAEVMLGHARPKWRRSLPEVRRPTPKARRSVPGQRRRGQRQKHGGQGQKRKGPTYWGTLALSSRDPCQKREGPADQARAHRMNAADGGRGPPPVQAEGLSKPPRVGGGN